MNRFGVLTTLPSNPTDRTRVLVRLGGEVRNDLSSPHVSVLPIEQALPIRQFFAWPGKRNYEGSWWSSTVRGHVVFESLLEREYLLTADFDDRIVAIAAQPLALLWPFGTLGHKSHVPDFFVRLSDGDGRLVDVRPQRYVEKAAAQFEMTREICGEIGWGYEVFTGLPPTHSANLRWLAGYRQDRFAPSPEIAAAIHASFVQPRSLRAGIQRVSSSTGQSRAVVLANVYHLLWRRRLTTDLDHPLSSEVEVHSAGSGALSVDTEATA